MITLSPERAKELGFTIKSPISISPRAENSVSIDEPCIRKVVQAYANYEPLLIGLQTDKPKALGNHNQRVGSAGRKQQAQVEFANFHRVLQENGVTIKHEYHKVEPKKVTS